MFVFVAAEEEGIRSAMTGVMDGCDSHVGPRNETEPWSSRRVPNILNCYTVSPVQNNLFL